MTYKIYIQLFYNDDNNNCIEEGWITDMIYKIYILYGNARNSNRHIIKLNYSNYIGLSLFYIYKNFEFFAGCDNIYIRLYEFKFCKHVSNRYTCLCSSS